MTSPLRRFSHVCIVNNEAMLLVRNSEGYLNEWGVVWFTHDENGKLLQAGEPSDVLIAPLVRPSRKLKGATKCPQLQPVPLAREFVGRHRP